MSPFNARVLFGHAAASFEGIRASVGFSRPASVHQMADAFVRDVVFDEPIVTGDGVALGGHHTLTIHRDGRFRYQGHFRATGFPSFDVSIVTTLGYSIPVPGSPTPAAAQIAFAAHGRVHGTNEPGSREHSWDTQGDHQHDASRLPLALTGKVWCLVDADRAAVQTGDLLTTSPTPGHAMKAVDSTRAFGAVLGKALTGLPSGRGLVQILVALQ